MPVKRKPRAKPRYRPAASSNSVAVIGAISAGMVTIITALSLAWGSLHSGQIKAKAEREVERKEVSSELGRIHEQTNGHLSTMQAKVDAALKEIMDLKKSISDKAIEQAGEDRKGSVPR